MPSLHEQARRVLAQRRADYRAVFTPGPSTDRVLADLAKFCRANETTFHVNPRVSDALIGRREVFLRVAHHLNLSDDQLWDLYGNKSLPTESLTEEPSWQT